MTTRDDYLAALTGLAHLLTKDELQGVVEELTEHLAKRSETVPAGDDDEADDDNSPGFDLFRPRMN